MNACTVHLNFHMPVGHRAGHQDWIHLFKDHEDPAYSGRHDWSQPPVRAITRWGLPSPIPWQEGNVVFTGHGGFMMGVLPVRLNRQVQPYRLCEFSCTFSPTWHTMRRYYPFNYWAGPPCSLSTRTFVCAVCARTRIHICLFDSFNWGQGIG